jgi:hypothetical protein
VVIEGVPIAAEEAATSLALQKPSLCVYVFDLHRDLAVLDAKGTHVPIPVNEGSSNLRAEVRVNKHSVPGSADLFWYLAKDNQLV